MGNRQKGRQTEDWELNAISNLTDISQAELEKIYQKFLDVSKDYLLDRYEFRRIYNDLSPYSGKRSYKVRRQKNKIPDRIFKIFDKDHSHRLAFDEFIIIYTMLQNSIDPKIRLNFLLDRYSQSNDYISSTMGRQIIQDMSNLYNINTDYQQVWTKIEEIHGSYHGCIPKQAFIEYFINHPAYSSAFYKTV